MPASTLLTECKDLKLRIGLVTRWMARWSFDYVIAVFDLAHHNRHVPAGIDRIDGPPDCSALTICLPAQLKLLEQVIRRTGQFPPMVSAEEGYSAIRRA